MANHVHDPRSDAIMPPPPNFDGRMIKIIVGEEGASTILHEHPLRSRSKFFEAALSRDWKESVEREVKLPEPKMKYFKVYASWLYTNGVYVDELIGDVAPEDFPYDHLSHLYALGATMQDQSFQDAVLDTIISQTMVRKPPTSCRHFPANDAVRTIYSATLAGDPARRLMVDLHVTHGRRGWLDDLVKDEDFDFVLDLARAFYDTGKGKGSPIIIDLEIGTCAYHHHGEGLCYSR